MSSLYRQQLEAWLKKIDVKADRVLDVGGGQNPITKRVASWDVKEYLILDNDSNFNPDALHDLNFPLPFPNTVLLNEKTGFQMRIYDGDMKPESFDIIFCLEVMEYIWNPLVAHKNIFNVLKKSGTAYISYPTLYPLHNPPGIDYLRYTKNAVKKLLTEVGFKTWEITPRIATEGVKALSDFYSLEGMRPIKRTREIFDIGYLVKAFKNG